MSDMSDQFTVVNAADPRFHDPRYQRKIVGSYRPIPVVENMHDVTLECGHAPLVFVTPDPQIGATIFCPDCCEKDRNRDGSGE